MKQRKTTVIALTCGVICAVCIALFMWSVQKRSDEARAQALSRYGGEQVEVCVATRDIAAGERLDLSSIEVKTWIAGLLPEDAVCDSADALGQVATTSICKGEVVVSKRFEKKTAQLDIPAGLQAVSVPVKTVQAVGGNIYPGMRVDVYSTGDITTSLLVSEVLVLDTSTADSESLTSSSGGWIVLAVEPSRVQEIVAASNKTNLYFVIPGEQIDVPAEANTADKTEKPEKNSSEQKDEKNE